VLILDCIYKNYLLQAKINDFVNQNGQVSITKMCVLDDQLRTRICNSGIELDVIIMLMFCLFTISGDLDRHSRANTIWNHDANGISQSMKEITPQVQKVATLWKKEPFIIFGKVAFSGGPNIEPAAINYTLGNIYQSWPSFCIKDDLRKC
jgi:hypothetical protein